MSETQAKTITKKVLVNRISERTGQTKVVVKEILQQLLDEVVEELAHGNRLEFREFGVFEVRQRASRQAQNPRTLEKVDVPSRRVVKFKVGRKMRERVGSDVPAPPPEAPVQEDPVISAAPQSETPPPPPPPTTPSSPF
jgi:integration host factor subunit beta